MSNQATSNFCAHDFKRDESAPPITAIIWRRDKCKAVVGTTISPIPVGEQKSNLPSP